MEPLARLPVFLALDGKHALLAGGGAAAAWKAELLSAAGARVDVYAEDISDDMLLVAGDPPSGAIVLHRRGCPRGPLFGGFGSYRTKISTALAILPAFALIAALLFLAAAFFYEKDLAKVEKIDVAMEP
jgi:hypothetical protein